MYRVEVIDRVKYPRGHVVGESDDFRAALALALAWDMSYGIGSLTIIREGKCQDCNGHGVIRGPQDMEYSCHECAGSGELFSIRMPLTKVGLAMLYETTPSKWPEAAPEEVFAGPESVASVDKESAQGSSGGEK